MASCLDNECKKVNADGLVARVVFRRRKQIAALGRAHLQSNATQPGAEKSPERDFPDFVYDSELWADELSQMPKQTPGHSDTSKTTQDALLLVDAATETPETIADNTETDATPGVFAFDGTHKSVIADYIRAKAPSRDFKGRAGNQRPSYDSAFQCRQEWRCEADRDAEPTGDAIDALKTAQLCPMGDETVVIPDADTCDVSFASGEDAGVNGINFAMSPHGATETAVCMDNVSRDVRDGAEDVQPNIEPGIEITVRVAGTDGKINEMACSNQAPDEICDGTAPTRVIFMSGMGGNMSVTVKLTDPVQVPGDQTQKSQAA